MQHRNLELYFPNKKGDADTGIGPKQLLFIVLISFLFILLVVVIVKLKGILK